VGEDTLDMVPETLDQSYPLFGKVPLPPVMIQQLDMILTIGFLNPLRKKVLKDFHKIVLSNNSKSWIVIYLITFMSLHSCAILTRENYQNARKHGLKVTFPFPILNIFKYDLLISSYSGDLPCRILYLNCTIVRMSS
jgi:hypothetical protein